MRNDPPTVETLRPDECLRLLAGAPYGRLVHLVDGVPSVHPVNFVVRGNTIVVRTASTSKLATASGGGIVAVQADEVDARTRAGWSVTAVGPTAEVVDPVTVAELALTGPEAWGRPDGNHFIEVQIEQITGRWLHSPVISFS